jgi:hypothetical protein
MPLPDIHLQLNESGGSGGDVYSGTVDGDADMKNTYGPRALLNAGDMSQASLTV